MEKNRKNNKNNEKLSVWYARNEVPFSTISYKPLENNTGILYFSRDASILDPRWVVRFKNNTYHYDQVQLVVTLKDTLLAHKSRAWIRMGSQVFGFTILGCYGLEGTPTLYEKTHVHGYFRLYISDPEFDSTEETEFTNARLRIENKLLPKHLYRYGYCNRFNGKFMQCSDEDYLSFRTIKDTSQLRQIRCKPTPTQSGGYSAFSECAFQAGP